MEEKFIAQWLKNRETAARMGVRLRPVEAADAMKTAHPGSAVIGKATVFPSWQTKSIWS